MPTSYTKEACKHWFQRIKRELDLPPTTLATEIGLTPSTINLPLRPSNEKVVSLKSLTAVAYHLRDMAAKQPETAQTVASILDETQELFGFSVAPAAPDAHRAAPSNPAPQSDIAPAEIPRGYMADFQADPRSIPVLGTAAGSALGAFEIGTEAIDFIRRPPSLAGSKEVYAIYVVGESMVPQHNPGDLRIIHPKRPAVPGDSVVIQTYNAATDTREAFIKVLVKDKGREVVCRQHNPPMEITYLRPNGDPEMNETNNTYVIRIHKVLTMNDLHGF